MRDCEILVEGKGRGEVGEQWKDMSGREVGNCSDC